MYIVCIKGWNIHFPAIRHIYVKRDKNKKPKILDTQRFSDFPVNAGDRGRTILRPREARK